MITKAVDARTGKVIDDTIARNVVELNGVRVTTTLSDSPFGFCVKQVKSWVEGKYDPICDRVIDTRKFQTMFEQAYEDLSDVGNSYPHIEEKKAEAFAQYEALIK